MSRIGVYTGYAGYLYAANLKHRLCSQTAAFLPLRLFKAKSGEIRCIGATRVYNFGEEDYCLNIIL